MCQEHMRLRFADSRAQLRQINKVNSNPPRSNFGMVAKQIHDAGIVVLRCFESFRTLQEYYQLELYFWMIRTCVGPGFVYTCLSHMQFGSNASAGNNDSNVGMASHIWSTR